MIEEIYYLYFINSSTTFDLKEDNSNTNYASTCKLINRNNPGSLQAENSYDQAMDYYCFPNHYLISVKYTS